MNAAVPDKHRELQTLKENITSVQHCTSLLVRRTRALRGIIRFCFHLTSVRYYVWSSWVLNLRRLTPNGVTRGSVNTGPSLLLLITDATCRKCSRCSCSSGGPFFLCVWCVWRAWHTSAIGIKPFCDWYFNTSGRYIVIVNFFWVVFCMSALRLLVISPFYNCCTTHERQNWIPFVLFLVCPTLHNIPYVSELSSSSSMCTLTKNIKVSGIYSS